MRYNKSYDHSKFIIRISESIGRFFLARFPRHMTQKSKKERKTHMRNLMSDTQSEKTKIFLIRVMRNLFPKISIVWTFPDHLIVFGEKEVQTHIGISIIKTFGWSKLSLRRSVSRNLFPNVFEHPFWIQHRWRHRYESSKKNFRLETSSQAFHDDI